MKGLLLLLIHLVVVLIRLARPGGVRALVAENLSLGYRRLPRLTGQGIGIAVVCFMRSIAKRDVTSANEVPSIRRL